MISFKCVYMYARIRHNYICKNECFHARLISNNPYFFLFFFGYEMCQLATLEQMQSRFEAGMIDVLYRPMRMIKKSISTMTVNVKSTKQVESSRMKHTIHVHFKQ